jgi:hypothetical protein
MSLAGLSANGVPKQPLERLMPFNAVTRVNSPA